MLAIVGLILAALAVLVTIWAASRRATVTADAKIDVTNYISVSIQAGRSSVTVLRVSPVVPEVSGKKPGDHATVLDVSKVTFAGEVQLDAKQSTSLGLTLKMEPQMLPASDGAAPVKRLPRRDEIWVRIDYGRHAKKFVKSELIEGAIE